MRERDGGPRVSTIETGCDRASSILFLSTILFLSIISLTLHEIESCTYKLVMVFAEN